MTWHTFICGLACVDLRHDVLRCVLPGCVAWTCTLGGAIARAKSVSEHHRLGVYEWLTDFAH